MQALDVACASYIATTLRDAIRERFQVLLEGNIDWHLALDTEDRFGHTLLFQYPTSMTGVSHTYIRERVKMEFGWRSSTSPTELRAVGPYLADCYADLIDPPSVECAELRKYAERIFVCFDADAAGSAATAKSINILSAAGCTAFIVQLPPGEDPDTFVRSHGAPAFEKKLDDALPWIQFKLDREIETILAKRLPRTQAALTAEALVRGLPDLEWDTWRVYVAGKLGLAVDDVRRARFSANPDGPLRSAPRSRPRRYGTRRRRDGRISNRTRELPFEIGKRVDDFACFEDPITFADPRRYDDVLRLEPLHREIRGLDASADHRGSARNRQYRGTGKAAKQEVERGIGPHGSEAHAPRRLELVDATFEREGVERRAPTCRGERSDPRIVSECGRSRVGSPSVARCGQSGDVSVGSRGEDERDGGRDRDRELAMPKDHRDERAPDAAVAVDERVNRLELCVRDCRLRHGRKPILVAKCAEVFHERRNALWRRWDE